MAVNKVTLGDEVLVDLSEDTATPATVAAGVTFHDAAGEARTGTMEGGGTSDYAELINKPQINGIVLTGNKTAAQLQLAHMGHTHSYNELTDKPTIPAPVDDQALMDAISDVQGDLEQLTGRVEAMEESGPQRGVDYWTEDDIAQIKSYVDDAILGGAW